MEPWLIILLVVLGVILFFGIAPFIGIAEVVYHKQLVRKSKDMWGRKCSAPDNVEQVAMYTIGEEWYTANKEHAIDVEITSYDGLHLVGQYFDFGKKKCAIIHQGRTEGLTYSHYFTKPYQEAGYNILVVDPRAHGLSDGKYSTVGLKESKDLARWIDLVHDKFGNEKVFLHGICIGSATCLYAITDTHAQDYIEGIVVDGIYKDFHATMKTHMAAEHAPLPGFLAYLVMLCMLVHNHVNPLRNTPEKRIQLLKKPILMIHSKMDIYSLPIYAEKMYASIPGEKRIEWFDKGGHSHIRINNPEKYDEVIQNFLHDFIDK